MTNVTFREWTDNHDKMVHLYSLDFSIADIAEACNFSPGTVIQYLRDPRAQSQLLSLRESRRAKVEERVGTLLADLSEQAALNVADTVFADRSEEVDKNFLDARKHQDTVSLSILDRVGFVKQDRPQQKGLALSGEAMQKLLEWASKSDRVEIQHGEVVEEGMSNGGALIKSP